MADTVYVLTNEAMPGMVKIGITKRGAQVRMNELYKATGVPLPFECAAAIEVEDGKSNDIEKAFAIAFGPYKVNPSKEFYRIEADQVVAILKVLPGTDVTPQVNKETESLSDTDKEALKRSRRPNLNFDLMGIPAGSTLVSVDDAAKQATVIGPSKVLFQDEEMSLTQASKRALGIEHEISPCPRWTYKGRNLRYIYQETYGPPDP